MKHNYSFRRTLSVLVLLMASAFTWAQTYVTTKYKYEVTGDETVEISRNGELSGDIVLPSTFTIKGITYRVTSIAFSAFSGCSSITSVVIPESVTDINLWAFRNCTSLASVTLGDGVTVIRDYAFMDCTSLTSIDIPSSVTDIANGAFYGCTSLASITVSEDNPYYDSREGCNAIIGTEYNDLIQGCMNTIIPKGVEHIDSNAFSGCTSLTSMDIPEGVTNIWASAFRGCTSLASIDIPSSVTDIKELAFSGCTSLTTVICRAEEVPNLSNSRDVFYSVPLSKATLYVPASALEAYKAANQWKNFGTILPLKDDEDGIDSPEALLYKGTNTPYYTLDGKPAANPTRKGIYVKDGRKVMLR